MTRRAVRRICSALRPDAGASAVEFGLLLPLFVMLTIGTISAGFAFHAWLTVTHGSQESSRFAATLSIKASALADSGTVATWLGLASSRAMAASNIDPSAAEPGTTVCVALVSPTNIPTVTSSVTTVANAAGVMVAGAAASAPCPEVPVMTGDYVQTYVAKPVDFNYLFGSARITVASKSVNRFEAVSLS